VLCKANRLSVVRRKLSNPTAKFAGCSPQKVPWRDAADKIIGLVGVGRDITDKKTFGRAIPAHPTMENVGQRASGIAHDFNNVLMPIFTSAALLREKIQDKECLELLDAMEASAERGAEVAKQVRRFGASWKASATQSIPSNFSKAPFTLFLKHSTNP